MREPFLSGSSPRAWNLVVAALIGLFVAVAPLPGSGVESPDAAEREARIRAVEDALMAPCCWVNTLSNHSSALSEQLKGEIRARIDQGQSVDEILDLYVAKYGERILAAPKASGFNALAWAMPFVFVAFGGVVCLLWMWRRRVTAEPSSGSGPVQVARVAPDAALVAKMEAELAGME